MKPLSLLAALALAALCVSTVAAQAPDRLTHYHVLPRLSTLVRTGGFAGVHQRFRLRGEYDLIQFGGPPPAARFDNAEIWGSQISDSPTIAIVEDVDQILNLENLRGEQLPVGAPFDVYQFTGKTEDGSRVNLFSALIGPWMYVRGGTQGPEGSADFFEYHVRMLSRIRPFADLNEDGRVDAADYTLMRDNASLSSSQLSLSDWRSQFGEEAPSMESLDGMMDSAMASLATASSVPEPTGVVLLCVGALFCARRRPRLFRVM